MPYAVSGGGLIKSPGTQYESGTLATGTTNQATITFQVRVDAFAAAGTTISNQGTVTSGSVSTQTDGNTATAGNQPTTNTVVIPPPGILTGTVFGDTDRSGTQNGTETVFTAQSVTITAINTVTGQQYTTTTTTGTYTFSSIPPGSYTITATSSGYTTTTASPSATVTSGTTTTATAIGLAALPSSCSTLYAGGFGTGTGTPGTSPYQIFSVDTGTGLKSVTLTPDALSGTAAVGRDPVRNRLYYIGYSDNKLYYYDLTTGTTGTLTTALPTPTSGNYTRLAFTQDGVGYASSGSANTVVKFTVNAAGTDQTNSGATALSGLSAATSSDFAFTSAGRAWLVSDSVIYRINMTTGVATPIWNTTGTIGSGINGVAFDANGNLLVANGTQLYSINMATLQATAVGSGFGGTQRSADLATCVYPTLNSKLEATETVSPSGAVSPGTQLTYTITVNNTGNAVAVNSKIVDSIPANTTYVAGSTTLNGTTVADVSGVSPLVGGMNITSPSSGSTTYSPGVITTNSPVVVTFKVTVNNPFPSDVNQVANRAIVSYDSGYVDATVNNPSNNAVTNITNRDYGDAPDTGSGTSAGNYRTLASDNGPSHTITSNLKLGTAATDHDDGTLQNAAATADDITTTDDEDGVASFPAIPVTAGQAVTIPVTVANTSGATAYLVGYLDFNKDGSFLGTNEQSATVSVPTGTTGSVNVTFTTPSGLVGGTTYARFRIANSQTEVASPFGAAASGEVEDYQVLLGSPDLRVAKAHTGNFVRGGTGTYTITVTNDATTGNAPTIGTITVVDTLPTGLSVNLGAAGSVATDNANWTCNSDAGAPQKITCTSTTSIPITAGSNTSTFSFSVDVLPTAASSVTNNVAVSGGGEATANNGNNAGTDPTTTIPSDYGDAPDTGVGTGAGNYRTTYADNGPRHAMVSGLNLGTVAPDGDNGTLQNTTATADDTNATDDEDGVSAFPVLTATVGSSYTVSVGYTNTTGSSATLAGYIDFNRDGDFLDAGEAVSATVNASGAQALTFTVPTGVSAGTTYARFRIASVSGEATSSVGFAGSGEVEDYQVTINTPVDLSITKTGPVNAVIGNEIVYTITVTNGGPNSVTNATFSDAAPSSLSNLSVVSPTPTAGGGATACTASLSGNTLSGTLSGPSGAICTVKVKATVGTTTSISNTATVAPPTGTTDTNTANDSATATTTVKASTDINTVIPFGPCPVGGQLIDGSPSTFYTLNSTTAALTSVANIPKALNAMGFNPLDGRLYARALNNPPGGAAGFSIFAIGAGGTYTEYGYPITGMPGTQTATTGDVDGNGYLHIAGTSATNPIVSVIDVTPSRSATFMTVVRTYNRSGLSDLSLGVDMAYNPNDGLFYSLRTGTNPALVTLNPTTGVMATVGTVTGLSLSFGAQYMFNNSQLMVVENASGLLYRIDFSNPASLRYYLVGNTGISGITNNDGSSCPNQAYPADFSDAPATYGAPSHLYAASFKMGSTIDTEAAAMPSAAADGDDTSNIDDEDGVASFPVISLAAGQTVTVPVAVSNTSAVPAYLVGYLDFNKDGDFLDAGERSATVTVAAGTTGSVNVSFTTPAGLTVGTTYARFRFGATQTEVESPTAAAQSGEVEDYLVGLGSPDLTIDKSHSGDFVRGSTGSYTVVVTNSGTTATSGTITVVDTLPTGLSVNSGAVGSVTVGGTNGANWTCNSDAGAPQKITCTSTASISNVTTPTGNNTSTFSFEVSVATNAAATVTNSVTVSGGGEAASNTTNNDDQDVTTTVGIDLKLTKTAAPISPQPGDTVIYTIKVENLSNKPATNVTVDDTLPAGVTLVETAGCTNDASAVPTCELGTVAGGASKSFTVEVTVDDDVALSTTITNTATVSADQPDSDTTNDTATADIIVGKIELVKQVCNSTKDDCSSESNWGDAGVAEPKDVLEYRITYTNHGLPVFDVVLTDDVPTDTVFLPDGYPGGADVLVKCPDATLAPLETGATTSTSNVTINLAAVCVLDSAPRSGGSTDEALLTDQTGYFAFKVTIP